MTEKRPGITFLNGLPSPMAEEIAIGLIALTPALLGVGFGLVSHSSHTGNHMELLAGRGLNWTGLGTFLTGAVHLAAQFPRQDATNTENTLQP